jgi:hypothetical protein
VYLIRECLEAGGAAFGDIEAAGFVDLHGYPLQEGRRSAAEVDRDVIRLS